MGDTTEAKGAIETPPTPSGYADPYRVEYPTILLFLGSVALGLLAAGLFGWLLLQVQGPAVFSVIFTFDEVGNGFQVTADLGLVAIPFVSAIVVTVIIHELIHGLAFRWHGYAVNYGFLPSKGAFYTAAIGQYQQREHLITVGLAPLVCISLVAIALLFVSVPLLAITAYFVLILNTAGSIGDLIMTWRLWRLPTHSLVYDTDITRMYVFEPTAE